MAVQGVNGGIFELLLSPDKNIQDFIAGLKPGDALRGRVVELMPSDNKAVINFNGFNLVSQLPEGSVVQKGDVINVTVSQMDNRIFMKINTEALGRTAEVIQGQAAQITGQQLIEILNGIKAPVNEQNVFIAQKLIDYHLPVTRENIELVNKELGSYMQNRGIDIRAFNMDTLAAAKDIALSNFFRLGLELNKAASALKNMAEVMESRGQHLLTRNDIAIRSLNTINVLSAAAAAAGGSFVFNPDGSGMTLNIDAPAPGTVKTVLDAAVKEGVITTTQAQAALRTLQAETVSVAVGREILISKQAGKIDVQYKGVPQAIESITSQGSSPEISALKEAAANKLFNAKALSGTVTQSAITNNITGLLTADAKALLVQARDIFTALNKNVFMPQNTNLQDNAKETMRLLKSFETAVSSLTGAANSINVKASDPEWMAVNRLKSDLYFSMDSVKAALSKLDPSGTGTELKMTTQDYGKYQSIIRDFITGITGTELFKPPENAAAGASRAEKQGSISPVQVNLPVDVESTIEALVFLRSRNLPVDNSRLTDIMSKYFKNDLTLNRSIEKLGSAIATAENVFKQARSEQPVKDLISASAALKSVINDLTIKTNDSGLKAGIIESQFRNFLDKSGLNLENKLMNAAMTGTAARQAAAGASAAASHIIAAQAAAGQAFLEPLNAGADAGTVKKAGTAETQKQEKTAAERAENAVQPALGDNLKSKAAALLETTGAIDETKASAQQKQAIRHLREAAGDLLANLNALSLMNQKPVSFDMAYTQIPVIFNNKLFNGELQVWYRKGAPKEDLKNTAVPVNMVFMLNTSNIGQVRVSMTVYKNEVECSVKAGSEKAKQALLRNKADFLGSLEGLKYNIKNFAVQVEEDGPPAPSSGEGYINIGRINLQA